MNHRNRCHKCGAIKKTTGVTFTLEVMGPPLAQLKALGVLLVANQPTYLASAGDAPLLSHLPQMVQEVTPMR